MKPEKKLTREEYQEYAGKLLKSLADIENNIRKRRNEFTETEYKEHKGRYFQVKNKISEVLRYVREYSDIQSRYERKIKYKDLISESSRTHKTVKDETIIDLEVEELIKILFPRDEYEDDNIFDEEDFNRHLEKIELWNLRKRVIEKKLYKPIEDILILKERVEVNNEEMSKKINTYNKWLPVIKEIEKSHIDGSHDISSIIEKLIKTEDNKRLGADEKYRKAREIIKIEIKNRTEKEKPEKEIHRQLKNCIRKAWNNRKK